MVKTDIYFSVFVKTFTDIILPPPQPKLHIKHKFLTVIITLNLNTMLNLSLE